jgi:hypothetical protein
VTVVPFALFLFLLLFPPLFFIRGGEVHKLLLESETSGFTTLNKNVTPYSFVDRYYQYFGGTCCLHIPP